MAWDPVWEDVYRSRPWGQYPGEDVIRFVAGNFFNVSDRAAVRLLDVGSGAGANLWFLAREGFSAYGIDGSETAVRLARERLDRECPGWRRGDAGVLAGDIAQMPYPDGYFDGALDVVAGCYSDFDAACRIYSELARVVRHGGKLFVRTFARDCWGDGTGSRVATDMWTCSEGPLAGLGATRFTAPDDVPQLLAGWQVDRIEQSSVSEGGHHHIRHLLIHATRT